MKTLPLSTVFLCLALSATCALQVPTPVRAEDERKRDDPFEINNPHDLTFPGRRRDYEYSRMKAWLNDLGVKFVKIPLRRKNVEKFTEGKTVYDWSRPDLLFGTLPHDADVLLTLSGVDSDGGAPWGGGVPIKKKQYGAYRKFLDELAERYKGRIRRWMIGLEPNEDWKGKPEPFFLLHGTRIQRQAEGRQG